MLGHAVQAVKSVDPHPLALVRCLAGTVIDMGADPVMVRHQQNGAALTMLCANGAVKDDEPVLALDCDNMYDPASFTAFLKVAEANAIMGRALLLTTTRYTGDNWSFVQGYSNAVFRVVEKRRISNRITCGATLFPSWAELRMAICHMLSRGEKVNGEYYLAPCVNYLTCAAHYHDIPPQAFNTVGTPEDLEAYEKTYGEDKKALYGAV